MKNKPIKIRDETGFFGRIVSRKKKGFIVTLEVMATVAVYCLMILGNFYIMQAMDRQKFMYNALISGVSQASRWGGTYNTMYQTYNKNGMSIEDNLRNEIKRATGLDVEISITPEAVQHGDETIKGSITWEDVSLWFWRGGSHTVNLETESIVTGGTLINQ